MNATRMTMVTYEEQDRRPMGSRSGERLVRWLQTICILLLAMVNLAAAELSVSATVPWCDEEGWSPVRVEANSPRDITTVLHVRIQPAQTELPLHLAAGRRDQRWILIPTSGQRWLNSAEVTWTLSHGDEERIYAHPILDSNHALALVRPANANGIAGGGVLSALNLPRRNFSAPSDSGSTPFRPAELDPALLPDQWQAYPTWLVLVFLPGSEATVSEAQRQALRRWVGQGGTVVMDPAQHALWTVNQHVPLALPMEGELAAPAQDERWKQLAHVLTARMQAQHTGFERDTPDDRVPGTDGAGKNLALVAVFMTAFLALAPWLWARRRQQPLFLLVSIPLCSGTACLVLLGWDVARYGLSASRTAELVTLIEANAAEHTTWSSQTRFGAWAVGELPTSNGERWLLPERNDYWRGNIMPRTHDQTRQMLTGDLLRGRENAHLACTLITPDQRGVAMRYSAGQWRVTNNLGVTIRTMEWIAPDGTRLGATDIPAHSSTPLRRTASVTTPNWTRLPVLAQVTWNHLTATPGSWRAELAAPLMPLPGLIATDVIPPRAFACGVLMPEDMTP